MSETFTDFPTFPHPPGQSEGPTASTMGPKSRAGHLCTRPLEPWAGSVPCTLRQGVNPDSPSIAPNSNGIIAPSSDNWANCVPEAAL